MSPHTCYLCVRSVQATQEKVTAPPGAHPGSRTETRHAANPMHKPWLRQAQPERLEDARRLRQAQPERTAEPIRP